MTILTEGHGEHSVASGQLFTVGFTSPSIAAAGTYLFGMTMGSRPIIFMDRIYTASISSGLIELFETSYTDGTPVTARDRNFVSGNTAPATFASAPIATPSGAVLATVILLAADTTGNANAGLLTESERFILKPNTQYVVRATNTSGQAGVISARYTFRSQEIAI